MASDPLIFRTEMHDGTAVVFCSGRLVAGETGALRTEVKSLFPRAKRVTLDLRSLTGMDSIGLGSIVSLYVSAKSAGCEFQVINFGERVRQLLIVTNLIAVFEAMGTDNIPWP